MDVRLQSCTMPSVHATPCHIAKFSIKSIDDSPNCLTGNRHIWPLLANPCQPGKLCSKSVPKLNIFSLNFMPIRFFKLTNNYFNVQDFIYKIMDLSNQPDMERAMEYAEVINNR